MMINFNYKIEQYISTLLKEKRNNNFKVQKIEDIYFYQFSAHIALTGL